MHMLSVCRVIFHLFQEILTKKDNWLWLRWLRQRLAEAEIKITHLDLPLRISDLRSSHLQ